MKQSLKSFTHASSSKGDEKSARGFFAFPLLLYELLDVKPISLEEAIEIRFADAT